MRFRSWGALGAFAVLGALLVAIPASGAVAGALGGNDRTGTTKTDEASGQYIVRLAEAPVVAYEGGIDGYKATKPGKKGEKINPNHPDVVKYAGYLDSRHDAVLGAVGGSKLYDYRYSLNGFAAKLSSKQADALKATPGVISVEKDSIAKIQTSSTPTFMGLDGSNGAWSKVGGVGAAGENVIIGVIDTGINAAHPSFSDRVGTGPNGQAGKLGYQQIPGWHGKCSPGEGFTASDCNQKLIGAQYFYAGFGIEDIAERDFLSPRDYNGHGSHTASTAGGNNGIQATGDAAAFGKISGMAPRARIAAYKVCWEDSGDGGCANSDSVAAIDQAVADGVDVINFSISGTSTNYLDAVEVAFLFAADAGVFVATSAGNSGPGNFTVAHISPWLSSVAAGTHNRSGVGTVTVGGVTHNGRTVAATAVTAPTVVSTAAALVTTPAGLEEARLCFLGSLDPAKVAGKIVFCDRGVNARIDKSLEVKNRGGLGMIMANTNVNSVNADLHFVPSIHVDNTIGDTIRTYLTANPGAPATISKGTVVFDIPAPNVAAFSSRGPGLAGIGGEDIMKPDFMAPGEDILAVVAPEGNHGRSEDMLSGTSMASPHVAGFGALLTQAHPDWSPAAMRSALATTAEFVASSPSTAAAIFNTGSGQVNPTKALDPGLVYDAGTLDYFSFLQGQLCNCLPASIPAIDASDLNQPSIAIGGIAGTQTVTRKVTNVASSAATYTAALTGPAGFTTVVNPTSFTIAPGETKSYTVTFTRTDAAFGSRRAGQLVWSDGTHTVRSPIIVSATALGGPTQINLTGASGSTSWDVKTGFAGALTLAERGLIPAVKTDGTVADDPTNSFVVGGPGITVHEVTIPAGTRLARFSLFDDFTDGADDLDLYVHNSAGALVGSSGSGTSAEEVNLTNPAAGTYKVSVHGWQTDGPDAKYTLFHWLLGAANAGNMDATGPATVTIGGAATINLTWTGLTAATKYLGQVSYLADGVEQTSTVIRVDVP
jgi:subtilisin family serine protease